MFLSQPVIITEPPDDACITQGGIASFTCGASGNNNTLHLLSWTWTVSDSNCSEFEGCKILGTGESLISTIQVNTSKLLDIDSVTVECIAVQTCANILIGEATMSSATLLTIPPGSLACGLIV